VLQSFRFKTAGRGAYPVDGCMPVLLMIMTVVWFLFTLVILNGRASDGKNKSDRRVSPKIEVEIKAILPLK
jgi:hypothetical protein